MRGELSTLSEKKAKTPSGNFVLTDGLMSFINSRKGDLYDFCKADFQNQLYKKLLEYSNRGVIGYLKSFDEDISYTSHGGYEMAHYYARKNNTNMIKLLIEYEKSTNVKKVNSMFNQVDITGQNATAVAFFNNQFDSVKVLVSKGYHCVASVEKILHLFYEPLKIDDVKKFESLIFYGFKELEQYVTYDGKNLAHLVRYFF